MHHSTVPIVPSAFAAGGIDVCGAMKDIADRGIVKK